MVRTSNFEPSRIPWFSRGRRGDGIGCRKCVNCRHQHPRPHARTVRRECAIRQARQQHPRNRVTEGA